MPQKNETAVLALSLLVTAGVIGGGVWWLTQRTDINLSGLLGAAEDTNDNPGDSQIGDRLSLGDKILLGAKTSADKQAGVRAMATGDFNAAATAFTASLQADRNDPEALIYLNNARAATGNALKIAVSVPIGSNIDISQEILRGVAQAQNTINQRGGVNGTPVQVVIANDDNDPNIVRQIAQALVDDPSILAVVGHNSSDASLAAVPIYEAGNLVLISPTSDAKSLSGISDYFFRTVPSLRFVADVLSRYSIRTANQPDVLVCTDSQAEYSTSLKEEFTSAIFADGGSIIDIPCDFAASAFNPREVISQAVSAGADSVLLIPSVDRINQAIEFAKANQQRLSLLGSSTLYTFATLQQGQADVNTMILAVAWNPDAFSDSAFPDEAEGLWGGPVNWRSAMSYDATQAILQGLRQSPNRHTLQQTLSNQGFTAEGASGSIRFLPSGDRESAAILVRIQPGSVSTTGYDFVPLR